MLGNILKDFGMLKEQKDHKLAQNLFEVLKEDELVTKDSLRSAIFGILRLEAAEKSEYGKFHKQFETLYLNRITHTTASKSIPQYSHTPQLNPNSVRLAERSRERRKQLAKEVSGSNASNLSLADLLILARKTQKEQTEMKKSKKAVEEAKACTFHPQVSRKRSTSKDKCIALYDISKSAKKLPGRTTEEIEYEKSKDELLFAPVLSK
eukprot:TRINITY_DN5854_c0_g2_i1.p3 TRINITY_DN5854_c0_g2~~TRINITY_DN5854_c0_g2_i1.p3  ORF type:complete len:208 (+),score=70.40 TRINITY_DN5854_c0_g2_i1:844-1467(+)